MAEILICIPGYQNMLLNQRDTASSYMKYMRYTVARISLKLFLQLNLPERSKSCSQVRKVLLPAVEVSGKEHMMAWPSK